jgi:hypothetical protein
VRLSDLNPEFLSHGGSGVTTADGHPVPVTEGVGYVPFANPIGPGPGMGLSGPRWQRTGDTFETLTLTPSVFRVKGKGGCGWYGFITNGEVRTV